MKIWKGPPRVIPRKTVLRTGDEIPEGLLDDYQLGFFSSLGWVDEKAVKTKLTKEEED